MIIVKRYFPEILPDNELEYFSLLTGAIESVDELSQIKISKLPNSYHFRIVSSLPKYNEMLIREIVKLHNMFHIHIDISKSIKSSGTINFSINNLDSK